MAFSFGATPTTLKSKKEFVDRLKKISDRIQAVQSLINKENKEPLTESEINFLDEFPGIQKTLNELNNDLSLSTIDDTQNVLFDRIQTVSANYNKLELSIVEILARDIAIRKYLSSQCSFTGMLHIHKVEKPEIIANLHNDHYDVVSILTDNVIVVPDVSKSSQHFHTQNRRILFFEFKHDNQRFSPDLKVSLSLPSSSVTCPSEESSKTPRPGSSF